MLDRLSGSFSSKLPAISVAIVAVIIASVFASRILLTGDDTSGLTPELAVATQVSNPTPEASASGPASTATPRSRIADRSVLFKAGVSASLLSPDGTVTIAVDSGSLEEPVNLSYVPLDLSEIPPPPEGYTASVVAFDLVPFTIGDVEIADFEFDEPVEIEIQLSGEALAIAQSSPELLTVQHYKPSTGWTLLPTRLELDTGTIIAEVSSLSIFAVFVEEEDSPNADESATATVAPRITPTPTQISEAVPAPAATATATVRDTGDSGSDNEPEPTVAPPIGTSPVSTATPRPTTQGIASNSILAPELLEPRDGRSTSDDTPVFQWRAVEGVDVVYELQLSLRNDFTPLAISVITSETSLKLTREQQLDQEDYKWRVRAIVSGVEGPFSAVRFLTVRRSSVGGGGGSSGGGTTDTNALTMAIDSPTAGSQVSTRIIDVTGNVTGLDPKVVVNEVEAQVTGGTFSANINIGEGENQIVATATDFTGVVNHLITITLDTPPTVYIDSPSDGYVTSADLITVAGRVNDLVIGSINGDQVQINVNGVGATVSNRSYQAVDVNLQPGPNLITAVGTDRGGNEVSTSITVVYEEAIDTGLLSVMSGNNQSGPVDSILPTPLKVKLVDDTGQPVADETVVFEVTENNATLSNSPGGFRALTAVTDVNGFASVKLTTGTRAGAGNNVVKATAVGFAGIGIFTASGQIGIPDKINVDAGNSQTGASGSPLAHPFVAVVTDAGHNRLAGIPVTFYVAEGGGNFDGLSSITIDTDSDGRVLATLTLGPGDGFDNNLVVADYDFDHGDVPRSRAARFLSSGMVPRDPQDTVVNGVVLDNTNIPIEGVTLHIEDTDLFVQSDDQGLFHIQPAPIGKVHLIADGNTSTREGKWPRLAFELVTVAGQDNNLGMPIFMLPLDVDKGMYVDETTGGTLTLDEVPGFSLTVAPGSATFPDGGKSGVVSVTVVHSDKVPMVPNFGMQPRFVVTIQPSGTIFDPPAPLTIPNVDGLLPGSVTEMYSFDHDLGSFVSIGTGTASDDGLVIASDPGFGIIKGGWHCGGDPSTAGSAKPVELKITTPDAQARQSAIELAIDETLVIVAKGGPSPKNYSWVSSDPSIVSIILPSPADGIDVTGVVVEAKKGGVATITVTFTCDSGAHLSESILIEVIDENIFFELHDPRVWPERNINPYIRELDSGDITAAMISGQNETSTGINPATVNDDNFEFKMKQPQDSTFSLHDNDTSEYEINAFKDLNGKVAVRIYPLIGGNRVAKKEGTYVFKFWNQDVDNDPFDMSSSNISGVRDFAGNKLDFIPNTQKPEPYVEITVKYAMHGAFIKISELPVVKAISAAEFHN